jgi:ribosomal protein S18 acetylase RimI-like enzyme
MTEPTLESLSIKQKPRLQIDLVTKNNQGQVHAILSSFGHKISKEFTEFQSKLVYFQDIPVGLVVSEHKGSAGLIQALFVLQPYQSYGCGSMLLQDVIEHYQSVQGTLLESKPTKIEIVVPEDSIGWFEKRGFTPNGTGESWFGNGTLMVLNIE